MGAGYPNIHCLALVFLLNVTGHGDVVAVGSNIAVLDQPCEVLHALAAGEGIEDFLLVFGQ